MFPYRALLYILTKCFQYSCIFVVCGKGLQVTYIWTLCSMMVRSKTYRISDTFSYLILYVNENIRLHLDLFTLSNTHREASQQMTFENNLAKGEIAHDEKYLLLPQCFQLKPIIILSFIGIFSICSKSSAIALSPIQQFCGRRL